MAETVEMSERAALYEQIAGQLYGFGYEADRDAFGSIDGVNIVIEGKTIADNLKLANQKWFVFCDADGWKVGQIARASRSEAEQFVNFYPYKGHYPTSVEALVDHVTRFIGSPDQDGRLNPV